MSIDFVFAFFNSPIELQIGSVKFQTLNISPRKLFFETEIEDLLFNNHQKILLNSGFFKSTTHLS